MQDRDNLMEFAAGLATRAGEITLRHFRGAAVRFKGDGSEVTEADEAAEAYVRQALAEAFPEDGIVGEEGEDVPSRSGRRWIVDPIDGTRSFASGVPLYGVLVALEEEGAPVLGCCHFPVPGETLVAARGAGAWANGRPAGLSGCDDLAAARVVTSGLEYWRDRADEPTRAGFDRLVSSTRFTRTWGDAYGYLLVATGRAELMVDPICGSYWDYAPLVAIFRELAAPLTTFSGEPLSYMSSSLAGSERLHREAMRALGG